MQNNIVRGYAEADERVERLRMKKRRQMFMMEEQREREEEQAIQAQVTRQRQTARENALGEAIAQRKAAAIREEKKRQLIREEAPELRELQAKLDAQTLNVIRHQQIEINKRAAEDAGMRDNEEEKRIEAVNQRMIQVTEERDAKRKRDLRVQKQVLEEQMEMKDQQRLEEYRSHIREKQEIDAVVRRIQEEDAAEVADKRAKLERTKQEFRDYLHVVEEHKAAERQRSEEEERKIMNYMMQQNQRKADQTARQKAKQAEAERILEQQTRMIEQERQQKDELDNLLMEFDIEMREERDRATDQARKDRVKQSQREMNEANRHQQRIKAARAEAERKIEMQFQDQLKRDFQAAEAQEKTNAKLRMEKRRDMFDEVSSILSEKRRLRALEKERELELHRREQEAEVQRKAIIESERAKMIEQHEKRMEYIRAGGAMR
eukprot:NODE_429_length_1512_cov_127.882310_g397_i0.p1 GENE.NODE_429_length_1512_cov_127.882310_g397_i0~~NODE_429_length_1512_cov_127.882310_g397_i0.p1  ORF type:complete len:435 (+),score=139.25 NODE_429_length_1512_cov_127.882310_g397_i0:160-1464(+)